MLNLETKDFCKLKIDKIQKYAENFVEDLVCNWPEYDLIKKKESWLVTFFLTDFSNRSLRSERYY